MNLNEPQLFELDNEAMVVFPPTEDPRDEAIESIHFSAPDESGTKIALLDLKEVTDDSKFRG